MKSSSTDGVPAQSGPEKPPALPQRPANPGPPVHPLPLGPLGRFLPPLATAVLRTAGRTWRLIERRNEEYTAHRLLGERKNVLLALWHDRILFTLYYMARTFQPKGVNFALLISASKDGELLARTTQYLGGKAVRGSSSRKGREALLAMLDALEAGCSGVVTPDGPRGPRYKAHAGITLLAQKSGVPIVPVIAGVRRSIVFNSWDRFMLPLPFTTVRLHYGDPIWVPPDADDAMREHFRQTVEDDLNALAREADDWRTLRRPGRGHKVPE